MGVKRRARWRGFSSKEGMILICPKCSKHFDCKDKRQIFCSKSCASQRKRRSSAKTHGACVGGNRCAEYGIWLAMRDRCNNPNNKYFKNYGARGIKVCKRWNDFSKFIEDLGYRPDKSFTLERINNDGNYARENCKWATRIEQMRNTRLSIKITINGKQKSLGEWSEIYNIKPGTVRTRKKRKNITWEEALSRPVDNRGKK